MKDLMGYALTIGSLVIVAFSTAYLFDVKITWLSIFGFMMFPGLLVVFLLFMTIEMVRKDGVMAATKDWGKTILQIGVFIIVMCGIINLLSKQ